MLSAAAPAAQSRPDFSGTWDINAPQSQNLRDDELEGTTLVIRQTDREMVIERTVAGKTRVIRYTFDGQESLSKNGSMEIRATTQWDGDRLGARGSQKTMLGFIPITVSFTETRWLSADGDTMTVESTFRSGDAKRKAVFNRRKPTKQ